MICDLLNEIGFAIDSWGKNPKVGTASVFDTINLVIKKGGIPIPAHIDGSDQAVMKLHKINSGAMKNILQHKQLSAVEIVKPSKFMNKDRILKKPIKEWITLLRKKKGLSSFAYFQGSDAHDLPTINKRFTYVKMTTPSFSGLETAIKMPASRVRISDFHTQKTEGLFIHSIEIKNKFFGNKVLRFNRHLNCITGKKDAGKSFIFHLMQEATNPEFPKTKGKIVLYIEKIINSKSLYYAFYKDEKQEGVKLYEIDSKTRSAKEIDFKQANKLQLKPQYYNSSKIEELISSKKKINAFLVKHFGKPTKANIQHFNKMFSIPNFLDKKGKQLLCVKAEKGNYKISMNLQWRGKKEKMKDFFTLSYSLRRTAILCMIIITSDFGPAIIDAPETNFDNEDITMFLVPIIRHYKDFQQVILFTNNPMLSINTDPDNYMLLNIQGTKLKNISSGFAIDHKKQKSQILNIMEGGLKSFDDRKERYGV
ncbi:MAG: hypothetical protein GY864_06290 [Desulfobacterales bacterium]|nr:hypothetical protein [Desulfobacterales bacterium]